MNYFKTDGIRGIYPDEVNEALFLSVGQVLYKLGYDMVIVGYDNRPSSKSLSDALIKGIHKSNIGVFNLGLSTTPRIEFESYNNKCIGAIITASHNPSYYNGLKLFIEGRKLNKTEEELISKAVNVTDDYYNHLLQYKPYIYNRIVIDCANGATSKLASKIFKDSNFLIFNNRIEEEINLNCGATNPNTLSSLVLDSGADMGFAFDGDGDRVIACDRYGNILDGDYLCYILALCLKRNNHNFNNKVVLTKMTNLGIIDALAKEGIDVVLSDTGDKNVLDMMNKEDLSIGSEASGHIILKDFKPYGDGILNVLLILNALHDLGITLEDVYSRIKIIPQALINIYKDELDLDLSQFKNVYSYIRKSGTEKCYRVFIQSEDKDEFDRCLNYISAYKQ